MKFKIERHRRKRFSGGANQLAGFHDYDARGSVVKTEETSGPR